jgi:hypothetical protein
LLRVVYLPSAKPEPPPNPYADIAAKIRRIRDEFMRDSDGLMKPPAAIALLDRTESELLDVLPFPEFAAMRDYVSDRFQQAREILAQEATETGSHRSPPQLVPVASRFLSGQVVPARLAPESQNVWDSVRDAIRFTLDLLAGRFQSEDIEVTLCVMSKPVAGASVDLHPLSNTSGGNGTVSNDKLQHLRRGLYAYNVDVNQLVGYKPGQCPNQSERCRLNLLEADNPAVECTLAKSSDNQVETRCRVITFIEGMCK